MIRFTRTSPSFNPSIHLTSFSPSSPLPFSHLSQAAEIGLWETGWCILRALRAGSAVKNLPVPLADIKYQVRKKKKMEEKEEEKEEEEEESLLAVCSSKTF